MFFIIGIMKNQVLFIYEFGARTPSQVVQTNRRLFGYKDRSFHAKYSYDRKGLLSDCHVERLTKGVLMTDLVNDLKVLEALHSQGTKSIKRFYMTVDKIIG